MLWRLILNKYQFLFRPHSISHSGPTEQEQNYPWHHCGCCYHMEHPNAATTRGGEKVAPVRAFSPHYVMRKREKVRGEREGHGWVTVIIIESAPRWHTQSSSSGTTAQTEPSSLVRFGSTGNSVGIRFHATRCARQEEWWCVRYQQARKHAIPCCIIILGWLRCRTTQSVSHDSRLLPHGRRLQ